MWIAIAAQLLTCVIALSLLWKDWAELAKKALYLPVLVLLATITLTGLSIVLVVNGSRDADRLEAVHKGEAQLFQSTLGTLLDRMSVVQDQVNTEPLLQQNQKLQQDVADTKKLIQSTKDQLSKPALEATFSDAASSSRAEPSERAVLRMIGIKASIKGGRLEATISVQNVGKYIALPTSVVWTAVKESPPLSLVDQDKLFDNAPDFHKNKLSKPTTVDAPNWRGASIIAMLPWYPGDVKSVTVHGFPDDPRRMRGLSVSNEEGWYVLTRALFSDKFSDKLGVIYRDSCTFFSVNVPNGGACLNHND